MRILYLSQSYVPSRRASSMQVMRMCAALARLDHKVELVTKLCPGRQEADVEDPFRFHDVETSFRLSRLPRPDFKGGGLVFSLALLRHLRRRRSQVQLLYCRDLWGAWAGARLDLPVLFEAHGLPTGTAARMQARAVVRASSFRRLVTISRSLLADWRQRDLLPPGVDALVAAGAADPASVPASSPEDGSEATARRPRIGYVGHLYSGRGIGLIAEVAQHMPDCDFEVVGGEDQAVVSWRRQAPHPNLHFRGFVLPAELPDLYATYDALLMPHREQVKAASGRTDIGRWTSPMKMFEYMASGKPIVASDLPVVREILANERNALLVPAGEPSAWQNALRRLLDNRELAWRLGAAARRELEREHTWDARARRVLAGI